MSNQKISELGDASVSNTDLMVLVDGGTTKKITVANFKKTGWVQYADAAVTDTAGQNIAAAGSTTLQIDGNASIISQEPVDASIRLWDTATNKIMPIASGDAYDVRVRCIAENYSGTSPYIDIELDIGGSQNVISAVTIPLMKNGDPQKIMMPIPIFTLATFISNGGFFRVKYEGNGSVDIHSASIVIIRTHSAL